ncbi:MAG TPA: thioesterase family protein [Hypericibacter adhaerens]|jgi:fluoroacetyl-CoA thioesterase|uniref:thioesterase family protein n=1 Tax=Hypericibacter adhaerens TaxID=2602016 RepID=UPI002C144D44|nr:thioesterase family protein [Hypericibacter adhaerens]HWA46492.1 thioesterase family protein [Hypericibacter adhaerens]
MPVPPVGLRHRESVKIDRALTVPAVSPAFPHFRDMPPVFATAFMVGFVEETCVAALAPHLEPGQRTVGTHVDLSHEAATPIGMTVTCEIELVAVEGRRLRFKVEARDDKDVIGRGHHERFIVDDAKFMARLEAKARG